MRAICDHDHDAVSTGSGSDRVSMHGTVEFAMSITRSLTLPVLTSSITKKKMPRGAIAAF